MNDKSTVLIVDDAHTNVKALVDILSSDYTVKIASNGKGALHIAKDSVQPDIILLDIVMPDIDGYEVCRQLKEDPLTKDIPVIFITAMSDEKNEEAGLNLGAIDYISKPFNPALVRLRVKNHLDLKLYRDQLKEITMIDGLTGISNKRRFNDALVAEWNRAIRAKTELSLMFVDIDYFKNFNDEYGHLAGDECLISVSSIVSKTIKRPSDIASRWGGEEFVCLLPETPKVAAAVLAEEMRIKTVGLNIPHSRSFVADIVTISIGVASASPKNGELSADLLEKTDKALYKSKNDGRNRVTIAVE